MTRRALARAALAIALVTVAARVFGFLRVAVFARTVGADSLGDTYQTANTIPNLVFEVVAGGALAAAVVPAVAGAVTAGDAERVRQAASALLTWVVLLLAPLAAVGALAGRPLMSLLAGATADPALRAAKVEAGARMLRVFAPQVVLYGVGVVATGVLHAHRRFVAAALAPLLSSVTVIGVYVAFGRADPGDGLVGLTRGEEALLAWGTTAGVLVLTLAVLVPLLSLRLGLRPSLSLPAGVAAPVRRLAVAGVAGVAAQQVALAVALRLANAEPGAVVVHQIALTLYLLPWAVLAVPVATSAFPEMAAAASAADEAAYARVVSGALRTVLLASCLAAAVLASAAVPLSSAVAGPAATVRVARAVVAFAPGLAGYGVLALLTRALYARQRASSVAAATVAAFVSAAAVAVLLVAALPDADRVVAIGAANSFGMTLGAALLALALRRAAGPAALAGAAPTLLVCAAAAAAAALAGYALAAALPTLLALVLAPAAALAVFAALTRLARLPALAETVALVRRPRGSTA